MMRYRKAELETLAHAVSTHWGGRARDWMLVVNPLPGADSAAAVLYVEIEFDHSTRVTTISLGVPCCDNDHAWSAPGPDAALALRAAVRNRTSVVAAVRRGSLLSLCEQCIGADIEPLLGYLRCCGVLVIE